MHALFLLMRWLCLAEALAAIAGIATWHKWKHSYLKWFTVYLAVITIAEITVRVLMQLGKIEEVVFINQLLAFFEIMFIHWFFYKTLGSGRSKIISVGAFIYIAAWIAEKKLMIDARYYFESLSYTTGNFFILIYLIIFFLEFVNSEKLLDFKRQPTFWITLGLLLFYLGTFPFFGLYNELAKNMNLFIPLAFVATGLNYCMYILFSIGLLWGKPD